ncbi:MAG: YdcF family protein [Proteobacteria bacterium]|nr:YdcF family protein [Pseudomonadota bacterium]
MKALVAVLVVAVIWLGGLLAFADRVQRLAPPDPVPQADGIVALTGASDARIQEAMDLLRAGKGRRLLVSGVNKVVTRDQLKKVTSAPSSIYDCCVDLDFDATNTVSNAKFTADWARAKGYRSLIVVTSDYHVPRSMLELKGAMPEVQLTAYPIATPSLDAKRWWKSASGARFMTLEYCKYLVVLVRESVVSLGNKANKHAGPGSGPASDPAPASQG